MSDFRNAYHFVPRKPPDKKHPKVALGLQSHYGLGAKRIADGHAAYAPGTHSGRITCRITLETPTIIGAKRHSGKGKKRPSIVEPFMFGDHPAIPASSLKGVLSSIAEVVSRAPYRVLTDMKLTVAWNRGAERHSKEFPRTDTMMGTTHDYVAPDALPLSAEEPAPETEDALPRRVTRSEVNPAEVMFGFIREASKKGIKLPDGAVPSAAGKLRFSHALPSGEWRGNPTSELFSRTGYIKPLIGKFPNDVKAVRLKEQSQPMKEPKNHDGLRSATPNFYFNYAEKGKENDFIDKADFATREPQDFTPQGTKFYLHNSDIEGQPWISADRSSGNEDLERKATVALLERGVTFDFHVDFDNLSDHELNILCYSLRPTERFRHKIGLGKALGLGSIRIDPLSLVLVDRAARYGETAVFSADDRATAAEGQGLDRFKTHVDSHSAWLDREDKAAKRALLAIGETHRFGSGPHPDDSSVPVLSVPLTEDKFKIRRDPAQRLKAEDESFAWFVGNDTGKTAWEQKLRPITEENFIPVLTTDGRTPTTKRGSQGSGAGSGKNKS